MNPSVHFARYKSPFAPIFLLILLLLLVYFNTLKGSFHFDDQSLLSRNWISNIEEFRKSVELQSIGNRPILLLTYAFNNTLHPKQVFGFHLTNLLLHVFASILIFHILRRTQLFLAEDRGLSGLPLIAALLFALHPLNTDSVSYISSRSSILATFFYLLSVYGFLTIFMTRPSKFRIAGLVFFCSLGFYLALASKLTAVTLPVSLGVWFVLIMCRQKPPSQRPLKLNKQAILILAVASLFFLALLFYLVLEGWLSPRDRGMQLFGREAYLFLQAKVVVFYYLKQFFFPINLNVDVGFPFSAFWTDLAIPLSMAVIAGTIICAFKRGNVFLKMGTAWFFLTLLPTSSIIPLNDLAVEHHTYLPLSLGLCMIAGWGLSRMNQTLKPPFMIFLFLALGSLTVTRNSVWLDDFTLWKDSAEKNPYSPRTQNNLGKAWYEKAEHEFARSETIAAQNARDQALAHFEKSIANLSGFGERYYNKQLFKEHLEQLMAPGMRNKSLLPNARLIADFAEPHYNISIIYLYF